LYQLVQWQNNADIVFARLVVVIAHVVQYLGIEVIYLHARAFGHVQYVIVKGVSYRIGMGTHYLVSEEMLYQSAKVQHVPVV
jgi:hypothetical protein